MDEGKVFQYAPVLKFGKGENFFPMKVDDYVGKCSLHVMDRGQGVPIIPPPLMSLPVLAEFPDQDHYLVYAVRRVQDPEEQARLEEFYEEMSRAKVLGIGNILKRLREKAVAIGIDLMKFTLPLDLPEEVRDHAREKYGDIEQNPPTYYYRVVEDEESGLNVIQYWFFYAYNDFATSHDGTNDHEADWEGIHLFFKGDAEEPFWATYSSHLGRGKELGRPWDPSHMEFEGDHPVVYVGAGSHASYHSPEPHPPDPEFKPGDVVVGSPDGLAWFEPEPFGNKPWFTRYQGRWGAHRWETLLLKVLDIVGGAPSGPKFSRDGNLRPQWEHPAQYAGLVEE